MSEQTTDDLVEQLMNEGARQRRAADAARKAMPRTLKGTKPKRGNPERDAQRSVVAWLRKAGCIVSATFTEQAAREKDPVKRARFGAARKASGATTGFPDLTSVLPDGRIVLIEMKAPKGGVLSDAQRAVHTDLEARGVIVVVGRDIWSVQATLAQRGVVITRQPAHSAALATGE